MTEEFELNYTYLKEQDTLEAKIAENFTQMTADTTHAKTICIFADYLAKY